MREMILMLVDDEERFLETTRKVLEKKGFQVITAQNGSEAMINLSSRTVDVVILDVKMPGKDGNTVLREIKQMFPLVEVIMLTGHATMDSAIDGLKFGAADYLTKPADIEELIQKAKEAYEKRLRQEEKIRLAQSKQIMKSPREIPKDSTGEG
jgi:DNA-binding NtrC family response regulator